MAVYVDVKMSTETALELLAFLEQERETSLRLQALFGEIQHQVIDSIEYEAQYVQGTFKKKPLN